MQKKRELHTFKIKELPCYRKTGSLKLKAIQIQYAEDSVWAGGRPFNVPFIPKWHDNF